PAAGAGGDADGAVISGSPVGSLLPPTSGGNSVITHPSVKPANAPSSPGAALENTYQTLSTGRGSVAALAREVRPGSAPFPRPGRRRDPPRGAVRVRVTPGPRRGAGSGPRPAGTGS